MKVRQFVWISSLVITVITAVTVINLFEHRLLPRFQEQEAALAEKSATQTQTMLHNNLAVIKAKIRSMATWDVGYQYSTDSNYPRHEFEEDSLNDPALADEDYDAFIWLDNSGQVIFARLRLPEKDADYGELTADFSLWLAPGGLLNPDKTGDVAGYLIIGGQPAMCVSSPVWPHTFTPEAPGGRAVAISYVDDEIIGSLAEFTGFDLQMIQAAESPLVKDWAALANSAGLYTVPVNDDSYLFVNVLNDLAGQPVFAIAGSLTRDLDHTAKGVRLYIYLVAALSLLMCFLTFMLVLELVLLRPLLNMRATALKIKNDQHLPDDVTLVPKGPLEFRQLAEAINGMVKTVREKEASSLAANEASRAKSEFLASMSHEIRTPLNGVLAVADLLRDEPLTAEQHEYVETIAYSGRNLLSIINEILDYSKLEAGKVQLEEAPLNLPDIIDRVVRLLAPAAESKSLELACDYPPGIPRFFIGDETRLRQVLTNLVGNAIKFTESGHVLIEVEFQPENSELTIKVTDTGIGIPLEDQSRLFQNFEQAESNTARRYGGTGLGLPISKKLVEIMGGHMAMTSEPGQGSCFFFKLRLSLAGKASSVPPDAPIAPGSRIFMGLGGLSGQILTRQLQAEGYKVDLADDIEQVKGILAAHQAAKSPEPYAVKLVEKSMAAEGSEEQENFLNNLTPLIETAGLNLLIISASDHNAREQIRNTGFDGIISKPVSVNRFMESVRRLVREKAPSSALAEAPPAGQALLFKGRYLVADDNPLNQMVAKRMLEKLGGTVETANGGAEAADLLEKEKFDIVFMDCLMPEMDGYSATRLIRSRESEGGKERQLIVALTANALSGDREKSFAAGMDDYMAKPFSKADMVAILQKYRPNE